jgi:tape measure domain-containing protein
VSRERIEIVVTESGSRVVKRNLEGIGTGAEKSSGAVDFLKKSLASLGVALSASTLLKTLDQYTQLQNRLRAVGHEGSNLAEVYGRLQTVSNDTRSSLSGSIELYSRLAVSSKELGVNTDELVQFTSSLNQAIILSGASAQEAQAGLIQLSQGMASGALRGDELRSVMEQLPAVADIIARQMGVTRGELRKMGEEGAITAKIILDAFAAAREELGERFAKTIPTMGQSFQILTNNLTTFVGKVDEAGGLSRALSGSLMAMANVLGAVAARADDIAAALTNFGKAAVIAATAYGTLKAATAVQTIVAATSAWWAYRKAIAAGTVVQLGSAEAERQKALAVLNKMAAENAAAATTLRVAQTEQAAAAARVAGVQTVVAQLAAERQLEVVRLQAQINQIGRNASMARLAEIRAAEIAMTRSLTAAQAELTAATTATATAQTRLAATSTAVSGAQATAAATATTAAASTTLFGQAANFAKGAVASLWAVIMANPFVAAAVALTAIITTLYLYRDAIRIAEGETTSFGDLSKATWEGIVATIRPVGDAIGSMFSATGDAIRAMLGDSTEEVRGQTKKQEAFWLYSIRTVLRIFDMLGGGGRAVAAGIGAAFGSVFDSLKAQLQLLVRAWEAATNFDLAGVKAALSESAKGWGELGANAGTAFREAFDEQLRRQSESGLEAALDKTINRAREIGEKRRAIAVPMPEVSVSVGGVVQEPAAPSDGLQKSLDNLIGQYDRVHAAQEEYRKNLEILQAAEAAGIPGSEHAAHVREIMKKLMEDSLDPFGAVMRSLNEESALLGLTAQQREIANQSRSIEQSLLGQGVILNEQEISQLRERLTLLQQETAATAAREQLLQSVKGSQAEFVSQLTAMNQLIKDGKVTQAEANTWLVESQGDLLEGTLEQQNAFVKAHEDAYAKIAALRQADLISEQTANQAKARADAELFSQRVAGAKDFFGSMSSLSRSKNRELFMIGKAASLANATISGIEAVQESYANGGGYPWGIAPAAAMTVVQAANVAAIAAQEPPGFAFGGDFAVRGTGGTDSQTVAFRATPGETVSIRTPTQNREERRAEAPAAAPVTARIINVIDPALVGDYLSNSSSDSVLVNAIRRNSDSLAPIFRGRG